MLAAGRGAGGEHPAGAGRDDGAERRASIGRIADRDDRHRAGGGDPKRLGRWHQVNRVARCDRGDAAGRLTAGILAAGSTGWRGGSSGFQPGMRWAIGRAETGLVVASASGRVGSERRWNPSGQLAVGAGSAESAFRRDRRWTTSTMRL